LVDGIVLHRFVTNSTITNSSSSNNAVDGFDMTRASTGVIIKGLTTNNNGRDGISLDDGALASGPNPAGIAVAVYGNNSVTGSTSNANGRNGITVAGGENLTIRGNDLNNDFMGIVLSRAASKVDVTGNTIRNSSKHAISVLSGVANSTIESNTLQGGDIAVYVRDSSASIVDNKISGVNLHGVTFTGGTSGSTVSNNHVTGSGPTAIDVARGTGISVGANDVAQWTTTKSLLVVLGQIFQPLTVLWCVLGLVLLISAISGIGRKYSGFRHPYADQVPLSSLTKGIATPAELGLQAPPAPGPARRSAGVTASASARALTPVH
jgi:parallel beta-helix repeat protein